jgi:phosphoribosylformylglycinamidine synthase
MKVKVFVTLKNGVLDPQGSAIVKTLRSMGFDGVNDARQGKYIELDIADSQNGNIEQQVKEMCEKLLANTVIENYTIEVA